MAKVELAIRGDLDYPVTGQIGPNAVMEIDYVSDFAFIDWRKNPLSGLPHWAKVILTKELSDVAVCKKCGASPGTCFDTCSCGSKVFRLDKEAWQNIQHGICKRMSRGLRKGVRTWDEAWLPGYVTNDDKQRILKIQKGRCYFCDTPIGNAPPRGTDSSPCHFDHLIPVSRQTSTNWPSNIVATCMACNARRGDKSLSALWTLLKKEKGGDFVRKRHAKIRKFDEQRHRLDAVRLASIRKAAETLRAIFHEELQAFGKAGVTCEVLIEPREVHIRVGATLVYFPGSFQARIVGWSESQCRKFCRDSIQIARDGGALVRDPI